MIDPDLTDITKEETVNILIVEDNPDHALLAQMALEKNAAWNATITDTIEKATGLMEKVFFKVILTDYRLPDGNGLDFLDGTMDDRIVIVMTSQGNERVAVYALQKGAYDYVVKDTLFYEVLPEMLQKALDKFNAQKEVMLLREKIRNDNQKLTEANSKLRELDNIKSEFISTASHELRTPLTIIREFVSLTKDGFGGPVTSEQMDYLDSALNNCDRLGDLIDEILDIEKMESGKVPLRRTRVDMAEILEEQYNDFLPGFRSKNQSLIVEKSDEDLSAVGDRGMIIRVLVNLLGNAHKYVPAGGKINLRVFSGGETVIVEVEDDGPGIADKEKETIFERFIQVSRVDGPGSQGTGLGLAIAKSLIEMQEGKIGVESIEGRGSKFFFELPSFSESRLVAAFVADTLAEKEKSGKSLEASMIRINSFRTTAQKFDGMKMEDLIRELDSSIESEYKDIPHDVCRVPSRGLILIVSERENDLTRSEGKVLGKILESITDIQIDAELSSMSMDRLTSIEDWVEKLLGGFDPVESNDNMRKVLVVDDDRQILEMIRAILASSGEPLNIDLTNDGYDACIRFGDFKPDLVILDVNMPFCDIEQIITQLRKSEHSGTTRILLISGQTDRFEELLGVGADDFLSKPFDVNVLLGKVRLLLGLNNSSEGSEIHKGQINTSSTQGGSEDVKRQDTCSR